jgi:carboxyl-terminal processing protease
MRHLLLALITAFIFSGPAAAQTVSCSTEANRGLTKEERQKNIDSFETVWQTVRDTHYDSKLGGVNWQAVREELRPRVEKAESMVEARNVMNDMLERLGHSHVGVLPASLYEDSIKGKIGQSIPHAGPGFDIRVVDGAVLVTHVSPGLPAAKAGVRPGWLVHKIDGKSLAPTMQKIREAVKKKTDVPVEQTYAVKSILRGDEGEEVTVGFLDADGKEVSLKIARSMPAGNRVQFGNLPPTYVHFESRKLDGDIGYFSLSAFLDPARVMKAFSDTVRQNEKSEGFVLDLRGNAGGLIVMAQGLGGWFVDQPNLKLGTMISRSSKQPLILNPRDITYRGPLAILVDECSASSSEFLAGGLQDLKRARVFGRPTPGAALPSNLVRLPNGDRLQYVVADYISANGKRLEGNGVQPDEIVTLDRQALLEGRDPILDAATQWIRTQSGAGQVQK